MRKKFRGQCFYNETLLLKITCNLKIVNTLNTLTKKCEFQTLNDLCILFIFVFFVTAVDPFQEEAVPVLEKMVDFGDTAREVVSKSE